MSVEELKPITTINYCTVDGENITVTKNNGVVTLVRDKNGVRQMPIYNFWQEFMQTLPKISVDKTPEKDTVSFSGKSKQLNLNDQSKQFDADMNLKYKDNFWRGYREVTGTIDNKDVNFKLKSNGWLGTTKLSGIVDGKLSELQLKYIYDKEQHRRHYELSGTLENEELAPYLQILMMEHFEHKNMVRL